jgi:hypothetical protein
MAGNRVWMPVKSVIDEHAVYDSTAEFSAAHRRPVAASEATSTTTGASVARYTTSRSNAEWVEVI